MEELDKVMLTIDSYGTNENPSDILKLLQKKMDFKIYSDNRGGESLGSWVVNFNREQYNVIKGMSNGIVEYQEDNIESKIFLYTVR